MSDDKLQTLLNFLKDDPDDIFTHYAIGMEYLRLRDHSNAATKLEEVIRRDPGYLPAYQQLGVLYARINRDEDAIRTLETGIKVASAAGDTHARQEMEDALNDIEDD